MSSDNSDTETFEQVNLDNDNGSLVLISDEDLQQENIPVHLNRYVSETAELK